MGKSGRRRRVRKTKCTSDRPACVQCLKAAAAKGCDTSLVRCVYSAASVFATSEDREFEAARGGRGAQCYWGEGRAEGGGGGDAVARDERAEEPEEEDVAVLPSASASTTVDTSAEQPARSPSPASSIDTCTLPSRSPSPPDTPPTSPFTARLAPTPFRPPPLPLPVSPPSIPSAFSTGRLAFPPSPTRPALFNIPARSTLATAFLVNPADTLLDSPLPSRLTLRTQVPLAFSSTSTPLEPLPSTLDAGFWAGGPLSHDEVNEWPGLKHVAKRSIGG
ncbi:hypothetical protein NBRC10512_007771 [Rhodotorula toruloides]|uniref:Uncharacterized protein n=1 Tax=Rhodotorula toruloides (strain NP11) TaxID=1130832 RepID=M7WNM7_RHOT1|nr:uncharacterized protein RHTO_04186 [Rhodotorula toruloides NP11]EMS19651.1 hypothetical protein RHTO_04186 [Rhodotorula toruloides NP11]